MTLALMPILFFTILIVAAIVGSEEARTMLVWSLVTLLVIIALGALRTATM